MKTLVAGFHIKIIDAIGNMLKQINPLQLPQTRKGFEMMRNGMSILMGILTGLSESDRINPTLRLAAAAAGDVDLLGVKMKEASRAVTSEFVI